MIRNAEGKSLSAISSEMRELAGRARDKKLKPAEYQGGSAAISNLGMYGVREFAAIINPPHATILAVGASQRRPVEAEDGDMLLVPWTGELVDVANETELASVLYAVRLHEAQVGEVKRGLTSALADLLMDGHM